MSIGVLVISTLLLELAVLRRLRFDWVVVAIVLTGTLLDLHYLTYTSVDQRNYDGPSQLEYIQSIASTWRPPEVFSCVACGHPPLYYVLGALWTKTVLLGGWLPLELGLQWLSLLLFFAFVVFALLLVRRGTTRLATLWLSAALVVFWPSSIINSVRVHNDALASPLMLAAIYFIAEWDRDGRAEDFRAALGVCTLALLTKASGYAVASALLLVIALRFRATGVRKSLAQFAVSVLVFGTSELLVTALRVSRMARTPCQLILGSACNGRYRPPIPDSPSRFLAFHVHDFVGRLATVPEDPFLNRFAKSSLFGVQPLGDPFTDAGHELLGRLLSVGLLLMVGVCLFALPRLGRTGLHRYRAYLASVALMLLSLLAFRLRAPNEFHEDFRHIFAALVPFCFAYAAIVTPVGGRPKWWHGAGLALALLMIAGSVLFFARVPRPAPKSGLRSPTPTSTASTRSYSWAPSTRRPAPKAAEFPVARPTPNRTRSIRRPRRTRALRPFERQTRQAWAACWG